jgi:hypothetical protein
MNATRRSLLAWLAGGALAAAASSAFADQLVIRERAMPPLKVEVVPERPHPGWSWVKGHWRWEDRDWVWAPGHWIDHAAPPMPEIVVETPPPPPSPREFWVRGHWVWEGDRWQWRRGRWVG